MFNIQAAVEATAAIAPDMNEAVAGGGGPREMPAAGMTRLRLISYIELGVHEDGPAGQRKNKELVYLEFELSGPKHPARNEETGRERPFTINITMPLSLNEKANFFKLFKRLNHTGQYKHFAQLLGQPFLGTVVIATKGEGSDLKTYANLRDDAGFTIRPPYVEDPETGESRLIAVDAALTPLKCFLWNSPVQLKEMWDSIFIDGRWDDQKDKSGKVTKEGVSKNYYQNRIRAAQNFKGSPVAELLFAGGEEPDIPGAETPERSGDTGQPEQRGSDVDPLAGM
jgi:hypothetical protein